MSSMDAQIWARYQESLKNHLSENAYSYLEGISCCSMSDRKWELCLPDLSTLNYVQTNLEDRLVEILHDVLKENGLNTDVDLILSVVDQKKAGSGMLPFDDDPIRVRDVSSVTNKTAAFQISHPYTQNLDSRDFPQEPESSVDICVASEELRKSSRLNERYTFDNFVKGNSNDMAYAAAKAVASKPGGSDFNPLFIYGGVGLGKTHLMQSIGNEIIETSMLRVQYMTSEDFTNDFLAALTNNKVQEFRDRIRELYDVVLIDDIQFIAGKIETQKEFFHTFNYLIEAGKQVVLTSDKHPSEIRELEERMRSRFVGCGTFDIQLPDYETRLAILNKKAQSEGIYLPADVADYIAQKVATNVRELEGCYKSIKANATVYHERISLALAQKIIDPLYQTRAVMLNADDIIRCVSEYFCIPKEDIMGKSRAKPFVYPRQIAMYLARLHTTLSFPELARAFNRDHSTIMSGVTKIKASLANKDGNLEYDIKRLEEKLLK